MKEYQKLAEDYVYDEDPHAIYTAKDLKKAWENGFLKARDMAVHLPWWTFIDDCTPYEAIDLLEKLGEKEV